MKITKSQLKQIIKEELESVLNEDAASDRARAAELASAADASATSGREAERQSQLRDAERARYETGTTGISTEQGEGGRAFGIVGAAWKKLSEKKRMDLFFQMLQTLKDSVPDEAGAHADYDAAYQMLGDLFGHDPTRTPVVPPGYEPPGTPAWPEPDL